MINERGNKEIVRCLEINNVTEEEATNYYWQIYMGIGNLIWI